MKIPNDKVPFVLAQRVSRLSTIKGDRIHTVPVVHVLDGNFIYITTRKMGKKTRNIRSNRNVTLLIDEYAEDWRREIGVMIQGKVDIIEKGRNFNHAKKILEEKYPIFKTAYPISEKVSVILKLRPEHIVSWDYTKGEFAEPEWKGSEIRK